MEGDIQIFCQVYVRDNMIDILRIRRNFLFLQWGFHILLYCLFLLFDLEKEANLLFVISFWYTISYAYILYAEIKYSLDFNPFQILILSSIQFVGLNGISMYLNILEGEEYKFGIYFINNYLQIGAYFLSLQHLLLYNGLCVVDYLRYKKDRNVCRMSIRNQILNSNINYLKLALIVYFSVWILRAANLIFPLATIGSFINNIAADGHIVALFILIYAKIQSPFDSKVLKIHWIIVAIEILISLDSGMKETILQNLIPYCIYLLLAYKYGSLNFNFSFISKLILIFIVVLNVFIYISVFRDLAIKRNVEWKDIKIEEVFLAYTDYLFRTGMYKNRDKETADKGLDYLMSRAGSIGCNSWSINYATTKKTRPEYLYYCSFGLIPRILWPGKPPVQVGGMMYKLSTGHESTWNKPIRGNICSVSIGFIGSCYFSLGIIGALIIPFFMGVFCALYWFFLKDRITHNFLAIWALWSMIAVFVKDCEAFQDCGIIFTAWSCVYMIVLKIFFKKNNSNILIQD